MTSLQSLKKMPAEKHAVGRGFPVFISFYLKTVC